MLECKRQRKIYNVVFGEDEVDVEFVEGQEFGIIDNIVRFRMLEEEVDNWDENVVDDWDDGDL